MSYRYRGEGKDWTAVEIEQLIGPYAVVTIGSTTAFIGEKSTVFCEPSGQVVPHAPPFEESHSV